MAYLSRSGEWEMKLGKKCRRAESGRRLAAQMVVACAVAAATAVPVQAVVVGSSAVQPFGVNGSVNIDFNSDGQTDFQIDHDRVTLPSGGPTLDFLQVDKNDI